MIKNGFIMEHIATGYPDEVALNSKEMQLAMDNSKPNLSWEMMCDSVKHRCGCDIIDNYHIEYIVINGEKKKFH